MRHKHYRAEDVPGLLPLLSSIGREIEERASELAAIEARIELLSGRPRPDRNEIQRLVAEAATHRRGIRLAQQELERLGCSVVGTEPLTFRIPGRVGKHSFVWQAGAPVPS